MTSTTPEQKRGPFRFIVRIIRNVFVALVDSYAVSTILLMLGRFFIGERWVVIGFFNTFLHLLWLPALLFLPVFAFFRQKRTVFLLLPAVLGFVFTYGRQFLPRSMTKPAGATQIKILTYNLLADGTDVSGRIQVIREANADIVALQEFSQMANDAVLAGLTDLYPYMALYPNASSTAGQAVISRFPITEETYWQYEWLPIKLGHLRVVLDIQGMQVVLYDVHPTHPGMTGSAFFNPAYRSREIQDLLGRLGQESRPVLMMGDFNMPDLSDDYARITAKYSDSYREAGTGLGWSFPVLPLLRLDYMFYGAGFQALEARVWRTSGGSDHRPLLVEMALLPLDR